MALPLAAAAGVTSSFGPCVAPRFVAITSLTANLSGGARWKRVGAFVTGLCASFILLGTIAGALGYLARYSTAVYGILALALVITGVRTLLRSHRQCTRPQAAPAPSAAFAAGFGLAAVGSPCCGPVAAMLGGLSVAGGSGAFGALTLTAFAAGHAVPLLMLAAGCDPVARIVHSHAFDTAASVVSGALAVALGLYYGVLA